MPGGRKPEKKSPLHELAHLIYLQTGEVPDFQLASWEPRYQELVDALFEVVGQGYTLVLRPGSGGRALGLAIWNGDSRPPAKWFYDQDELDAWADNVLAVKRKRESSPKE